MKTELKLNKRPLVSIIVNCFNGEIFVLDAIKSILCQTYNNWEIIFWDNCSTDNSAKILHSICDSRIKYFKGNHKTVLYDARNLAFKETSGALIAFLDVDDWWLPEKLERQVTIFCSNPGLAFAYTNYWRIDNKSKNKKLAISKPLFINNCLSNNLLSDYNIGISTLMLNRERLKYIDGELFDGRYNLIGDFDLVLRHSINEKFQYDYEPLVFYRLHDNNETNKNYSRWADEFLVWQSKNKHTYSGCEGYDAMSEIIVFHRALDYKLNGMLMQSMRVVINKSFRYSRWKLIAIILTPLIIINWVRRIKKRFWL